VTVLASATILALTRVYGDPPPSSEEVEKSNQELIAQGDENETQVNIPFRPITLSFENVCYDVKASTTGEELRLLHDVNGYFKAGQMTCLMGSSGAGKTTLMDVIALRKDSGTVSGDIRVNGFPQDSLTFRRCTGYVL
jgi:ABC-type multidrug transport system ATPase subunit